MKIRTQLLIGFGIISIFTIFMLSRWVLNDLRPRYLEMMEEGLADTANILASVVEQTAVNDQIKVESLASIFSDPADRKIKAKIYGFMKTAIDMNVYLTDMSGKVVFDSKGVYTGQDFSKWNNIIRTMRGEYGARSSRQDKEDPSSSILHVSAPVFGKEKQMMGVLTVSKPVTNAHTFIELAKKRFYRNVAICALAALFIILFLSYIVTRPISKVTEYALKVRDGEKAEVPSLGGEAGQLTRSLEQMVETLEGKKYVESYLETLTHELKSPLAAIRSAAELLTESPPEDIRKKFAETVLSSSLRMQHSVDRLLELSRLDNLKEADLEYFDFNELCSELCEYYESHKDKVEFLYECKENIQIKGDRFLLKMALMNLLDNAFEFTETGKVELNVLAIKGDLEINVKDSGTGIPEFAVDKVEERFYSLPRPGSQKRSTGLGLSLVKSIAELHDGDLKVANRTGSAGVEVKLTLKNMLNLK